MNNTPILTKSVRLPQRGLFGIYETPRTILVEIGKLKMNLQGLAEEKMCLLRLAHNLRFFQMQQSVDYGTGRSAPSLDMYIF